MNDGKAQTHVGRGPSFRTLVAAFVIASSVLLIIPMWGVYGVLLPEDGGHAHGAEELVSRRIACRMVRCARRTASRSL
jgi:hypothetical protein